MATKMGAHRPEGVGGCRIMQVTGHIGPFRLYPTANFIITVGVADLTRKVLPALDQSKIGDAEL
jgi:hypothetical protein